MSNLDSLSSRFHNPGQKRARGCVIIPFDQFDDRNEGGESYPAFLKHILLNKFMVQKVEVHSFGINFSSHMLE